MCPWSISEAEAQLEPGLFVRVHGSHIVAIPHVTLVRKEGDGAVIELDGPSPHRVPVSRAKIAEVKARLGLARRHASILSSRLRSRRLTYFVRRIPHFVRIFLARDAPTAAVLPAKNSGNSLPPTSEFKKMDGGDDDS